MGSKKLHIIVRYVIPVIGTYDIDEGMSCYLNNEKFAMTNNIDEAKERIRSSVADQIKTNVSDFQNKMSQLNSINVGSIDEVYREDAFKQ